MIIYYDVMFMNATQFCASIAVWKYFRINLFEIFNVIGFILIFAGILI